MWEARLEGVDNLKGAFQGFPGGLDGENLPAIEETWVRSLDWEDPLEKGKATHSSILAWRIPWTKQSMGSQSWTQLSDFSFHFSLETKY